MATTETNKEIMRLRKSAKDAENQPFTRISSARRLCREYGFSDENCRIGKRIAKMFATDTSVEGNVRRAALSLLQFVLDHKLTDEDEEDQNAPEEEESASSEPSERPALPQLSRAERLAKANARWNGVTDENGVCIEPPQKFLTFYESSDLLPYGIDLENGSGPFYSTTGFSKEEDPDFELSTKCGRELLNPKYLEVYRAWKQRRFNGELPDRMSPWYGLFEQKPECYEPNPAFYTGERLLRYMLDNKQIEPWEWYCGFLRDLWFEIWLCGPGSSHAKDEEFKKSFVHLDSVNTFVRTNGEAT